MGWNPASSRIVGYLCKVLGAGWICTYVSFSFLQDIIFYTGMILIVGYLCKVLDVGWMSTYVTLSFLQDITSCIGMILVVGHFVKVLDAELGAGVP